MPISPPDSEIPARHPEHDPQPVDLSRRKLGMGLGVSAIFTLTSRPVLAGQCMSPSSAASGNLSTHGTPPTCTGLTPAQWVALAVPPDTPDKVFPGGNVKFHDVFASGSSADWGQTRLYEVMGGSASGGGGMLGSPGNTAAATGPNPISAEFAATRLNIRDGRIPEIVLNETKLLVMWNEWLRTGTYAPMAGAAWNYDQIVAYLRSTQGA
jgi:hypothetical protein